MQTEHDVVKIFEPQRIIRRVVFEHAAPDDAAVDIRLQKAGIIADIHDRILIFGQDVSAVDVFILAVDGVDAEAHRHREGIGLLLPHGGQSVHEVVAAEDVAGSREYGIVGSKLFEGEVIRLRLVLSLGSGDDLRVAVAGELLRRGLVGCDIHDQQGDVALPDLFLILYRIGCFDDMIGGFYIRYDNGNGHAFTPFPLVFFSTYYFTIYNDLLSI